MWIYSERGAVRLDFEVHKFGNVVFSHLCCLCSVSCAAWHLHCRYKKSRYEQLREV